jgi:ferredoxin
MPRWRIVVDQEMCVGSGTCTATAAARFTLDEHDRSRPVQGLVEPDDGVLDAMDMCPTSAISVYDAETGEPVPS